MVHAAKALEATVTFLFSPFFNGERTKSGATEEHLKVALAQDMHLHVDFVFSPGDTGILEIE